jgi:hypothetical protein
MGQYSNLKGDLHINAGMSTLLPGYHPESADFEVWRQDIPHPGDR